MIQTHLSDRNHHNYYLITRNFSSDEHLYDDFVLQLPERYVRTIFLDYISNLSKSHRATDISNPFAFVSFLDLV